MTVIVWDGRTLAADKLAGDSYVKCGKTTKIRRLRDHLVGFSGDASIGREMMAWFERGALAEEFPQVCRDKDIRGTLLVINPDGEINTYQDSPYPMIWEGSSHVIGSGKEAALAVLMLGHDAVKAVEISCLVSVGCGNGIDTLELIP